MAGKSTSRSRNKAIINRTNEIGRVKKVEGSPRDNKRALLRFSSIKGVVVDGIDTDAAEGQNGGIKPRVRNS